MKTHHYQAAGELEIATTGNLDDLDVEGCSLVLLNNASLATLRGIKAGYPGQRVSIVSIGAGQVNLAHQNTGSAAANRLANLATSGVTPLAAGVGRATYAYSGTAARWRLVEHEQGAPIAIPYAAGDFTASGSMAWDVGAGDVLVDTYVLSGRRLFLQYLYNVTSVTGTASTELWKTFPNGYVLGRRGVGFMRVSQNANASWIMSFGLAILGETKIRFQSAPTPGNWTLTTNQTTVEGTADLEVS